MSSILVNEQLFFMQLQSVLKRLDTIEIALLKIQQELERLNMTPHVSIVNTGHDSSAVNVDGGSQVTAHDVMGGSKESGDIKK